MTFQTVWKHADRAELEERIRHLSPATQARWGRFDCPSMVAHVTDALRSGTGEVRPKPTPGPLRYPPLNRLVMFYLPWPKGAPTAPELIARRPGAWEDEIELFASALGAFVSRGESGEWPEHAAFGRISGSDWGRLMFRHIDHHLRQFGG